MLAYPGKKLVSDSNLSQQRYVVVNNGKGKNGRVDTCLTLIAISAVCFALLVCLGVGLHLVYDSVSSSAAARKPECEDVVLVERKWRAAEDRANRFESELLDVRRKHRALEDDYRELAMTARSQQAQQSAPRVVTDPPQDISAMQRLAKCRASVEASTEAIRELREHNTGGGGREQDLNKQVTRLQREVKDAIKDADESERMLQACQQRAGDVVPLPPPRRASG